MWPDRRRTASIPATTERLSRRRFDVLALTISPGRARAEYGTYSPLVAGSSPARPTSEAIFQDRRRRVIVYSSFSDRAVQQLRHLRVDGRGSCSGPESWSPSSGRGDRRRFVPRCPHLDQGGERYGGLKTSYRRWHDDRTNNVDGRWHDTDVDETGAGALSVAGLGSTSR